MRMFKFAVAAMAAVILTESAGAQVARDAKTVSSAKPARPPKYEHFMFGVFIDSSKEVLSVPLTKVFTDFLTHGVEVVCIGQYNYYPLARDKNLNTFAKANGVQLIGNIFLPEPYEGAHSEDQLKATIKEQVDAVNALPDSDVVVGWRVGDEMESSWFSEDKQEREKKHLQAEKNFQRFSRLIREIDPKRRVVVNHCYMPDNKWMEVHEDEAMSSTGATGIYNSYRVREQIAEARRLGFDNYFLVAQAMSCPRGINNLRWYGYREPINDAVLDSRTVAQHIQDYAEVSYTEGAAGINYFLYWAGGDNYEPYGLVDLHGDDYRGEWEAVKKAARNIRRWEGAPSCAIVSPNNHSWTTLPFTVTVEAGAPADDPVTAVKAGYSLDGALHWSSLPDAVKPPYSFTVDAGQVKELPSTVWVRVRTVNKRGPSLWDVIEARVNK